MTTPHTVNVLVADREPATRRHICDFLQRLGYRADVAIDGDEVTGCLAAREYHLLVFDATITRGDGAPLEVWVADHYPKIPVVVMSSAPSVRAVITAMRRGVFDYIIKPYEIVELSTIVPRAVEWYARRTSRSEADGAIARPADQPVAAAD